MTGYREFGNREERGSVTTPVILWPIAAILATALVLLGAAAFSQRSGTETRSATDSAVATLACSSEDVRIVIHSTVPGLATLLPVKPPRTNEPTVTRPETDDTERTTTDDSGSTGDADTEPSDATSDSAPEIAGEPESEVQTEEGSDVESDGIDSSSSTTTTSTTITDAPPPGEPLTKALNKRNTGNESRLGTNIWTTEWSGIAREEAGHRVVVIQPSNRDIPTIILATTTCP